MVELHERQVDVMVYGPDGQPHTATLTVSQEQYEQFKLTDHYHDMQKRKHERMAQAMRDLLRSASIRPIQAAPNTVGLVRWFLIRQLSSEMLITAADNRGNSKTEPVRVFYLRGLNEASPTADLWEAYNSPAKWQARQQ